MKFQEFPAGIICSVRLLCALRVLDRSEVRYYLALLFTVPPLFVLLPHLFLSASSTSHFLLDFSLRHPFLKKKRVKKKKGLHARKQTLS